MRTRESGTITILQPVMLLYAGNPNQLSVYNNSPIEPVITSSVHSLAQHLASFRIKL